jgi:hypothetical protein
LHFLDDSHFEVVVGAIAISDVVIVDGVLADITHEFRFLAASLNRTIVCEMLGTPIIMNELSEAFPSQQL